MITVFTPSFADEANTNAQNLTAKEIVSRLPADRFRVVMLGDGPPRSADSALAKTQKSCGGRGMEIRRDGSLACCSRKSTSTFSRARGLWIPCSCFFRRSLGLPVALVTYIVMALDEIDVGPTMARSIREADCVVGNSRYVAQTVQDRFGVAAGTIYSGIKRELFHPPMEARGSLDQSSRCFMPAHFRLARE